MDFLPDHNGLFNSLETGKAFESCAACRLPHNPEREQQDDLGIISELSDSYLVVKSFHRGECVFEYALCHGCSANMADEFSEESKKSLQGFYAERLDLDQRSREHSDVNEPAGWIARCATCGKDRDACESYSIGGLFDASALILDPYPMCFCNECEEEIQSRLSKKTLGIWDDFVADHFDSPPANMRDLPAPSRPMLI